MKKARWFFVTVQRMSDELSWGFSPNGLAYAKKSAEPNIVVVYNGQYAIRTIDVQTAKSLLSLGAVLEDKENERVEKRFQYELTC